jgi:signal transduction histidine kinase
MGFFTPTHGFGSVKEHPVRTGFLDKIGLTTLNGEEAVREPLTRLENPASDTRTVRRKTSSVALYLGFGGLLVFIVAAATGTLLVLSRARQEEALNRKAFLERLSALDQIRARIYLSGTYARDFLLSPDPRSAEAEASRLADLERDSRAALESYWRSVDEEEREPFLELRSEIEAYWQVLDRTMAWSPEERDRLRSSFFYNELVPRRTAMLQIADRITTVNERGLNRSEETLAASSGALRRSLLLTFGITLFGGLVLALLTIAHTLRLEREIDQRLEENTRARADLQELSSRLLRAQENERRTLARELHDEVGQSLSAILMEAESAECAEEPAEAREHLTAVRSLAEKSVNEVRDLALLLRPSMLDDLGLAPALAWHGREMSKRTGLNVVVSADDGVDDLPDEHKTCIYRLAQEAVNNSARHANARTVEVVVKQESGAVRLTVQDDGAGFDTRYVRGMGLLGMEERVRRLGGQFRIDSQPGRGTLVAAELPVVDLISKNGRNAHSHSAS